MEHRKPTPVSPVRVGLIGCGTQGRVHLSALKWIGAELVDVAGLCDLDEARLEEAGQDWPAARRTADYTEMVADGDVDLVILCTMPATHARIAVDVLDAGCHALVEKPFTMNTSEALQILDAAERNGRQVQVGTNMRYMPDSQFVHDTFASGRIGDALQCRVWVSHLQPPWWGPHYHKAVSSGGVLASTIIHPLDLALWTCGYPQPVTVSASARTVFPTKRGPLATPDIAQRYDVEDLFAAHVRFDNGLVMQLDGNWVDDTGDRSGFELIGSRGTIGRGPFRFLTEGDDGNVTEHDIDLAQTPFARQRKDGLLGAEMPAYKERLGGWGRSVAEQDSEIIGHIRAGETWSMQSSRQLLILQQLIGACYESAALGREIPIEPIR